MKVSLVVAHAQNRVIGIQNRLPWNLPEDLKRFKMITTGHPVIMGRRTYESIGRLLPHRENIIITRQHDYEVAGAQVFPGLDAAIEYCRGKTDEAFVIGGGEIYTLALPLAQTIYLTLVHQEYEGDALFPHYSPADYVEISREERPAGANHPAYAFIVLERRS